MVEAVVVIPTLLVLFAGLVFVWGLYSAKIAALGNARVGAWAYAGSNCGQPGDKGIDPDVSTIAGASGGAVSGATSNGDNGASPGQIAQAQGVTNGSPRDVHADTLTRDLESGSAAAQGVVSTSSILGLPARFPVTAKVTVMCNEPPYNASLVNMIKAAFDNLR